MTTRHTRTTTRQERICSGDSMQPLSPETAVDKSLMHRTDTCGQIEINRPQLGFLPRKGDMRDDSHDNGSRRAHALRDRNTTRGPQQRNASTDMYVCDIPGTPLSTLSSHLPLPVPALRVRIASLCSSCSHSDRRLNAALWCPGDGLRNAWLRKAPPARRHRRLV